MYRWVLTASALAVFGLYTVVTSDVIEQPDKDYWGELALLVGGVAGTTILWFRVFRSSGRRRRAWAFIASGLTVALLANFWLLNGRAEQWDDGMMAVGDAGLLLGYLLGAAGFLSFPSRARRGTEAARMLLDGIVVGGSILYIVAIAAFPGLLEELTVSGPRRILLLLIPVADAALATVAVLLILRSHRADRPVLTLLSSGVLAYAVADVWYAVEFAATDGDVGFGSMLSVVWLVGYALITLAPLHPANTVRRVGLQQAESSSVAGTTLVFGLFFIAAVMTIAPLPQPEDGPGFAAGIMWIAVLLAVAFRQILYVVDNRALRHGLEERVRQRTAELSKLTEQSELLLSSVGEGIYGVDRHGLVTFANPAAAHILGCRPEDLIGLPAHDAWHDLQDDGSPYPIENCYVTEAIRSGVRTHVAEDVYRRPDGTSVPVEVTASPLSSGDGIQGAVVVFRDTTQRREVDRMKSEFVSVVSHELRTPLTAIRGSLGLLAGGALGELPPRAGRMVSIALESSERLTRLINDILDLERIEAGTTPMDVSDQQVGALVEGAVEQMTVIAANSQVALKVARADGIVRANPDRVTQTLLNLLGNAIKFSPAGTTVTIRAEESAEGDAVEFRISDQGRGIPEEKLESIFKRFDQVDSSDAREKGGTGLGLAICKSIVERHGGKIWAESAPGEGSTFTFTLPLAAAPSHRPAPVDPHPVIAVRGRDRLGTEALCRALEAKGYRAVALPVGGDSISAPVNDGVEAPAAVVLDVSMSKSEAARALAEVRAEGSARDTAVVVRSGWHPEDLPLLAAQTTGWVLDSAPAEKLAQTVTAALIGQRAMGDVLVVDSPRPTFGAELAARLERRGLTVCRPRTKKAALSECGEVRPHVLVLDSRMTPLEAARLSSELREQGALADVPVVVYTGPHLDPETGDDLRLGRALFLNGSVLTPERVEARITELLGATAPRG